MLVLGEHGVATLRLACVFMTQACWPRERVSPDLPAPAKKLRLAKKWTPAKKSLKTKAPKTRAFGPRTSFNCPLNGQGGSTWQGGYKKAGRVSGQVGTCTLLVPAALGVGELKKQITFPDPERRRRE